MKRSMKMVCVMVCVCMAASQATTIIINGGSNGSNPAANQATIDFFTDNFAGAEIIYGDYTNEGNAVKQAQLAALTTHDMYVVCRNLTSSWFSSADQALYNNYVVPIISFTSYVSQGSRLGWEDGTVQGALRDLDDVTVTAAGAAIFGTAGPADWYSGTGSYFGAGSGTNSGTGTVLATNGTGHLVVGWNAGDTISTGAVQAGNRLLFNIGPNNSLPDMPDTAAGQQALLAAVNAYTDVVPEPATLVLLGLGSLIFRCRK